MTPRPRHAPGIPAEPPAPAFNMARYAIGRAALATPDKPALHVIADVTHHAPSETWTYAALEDAILRVAAGLAHLKLAPGARILIRLENTSDYALLFFGAIAAGYVPVPTSTQLTDTEAAFLLADSGAQVVALGDGFGVGPVPPGVHVLDPAAVADLIRHPQRGDYAATTADQEAFLIYTSGTTARPKGVIHAHRSAWGRRPMYQGWYGIQPQDRVLHAGAFNWTFTLGTGLTDPWANGATAIVYTGEKDAALWPRLIAQHGATIFAAVPGVYRQMLKYGAPSRTALGVQLRHGLMAGETPPPGLFEDWEAATGTRLHEAIGMSEISTYISTAPSVSRREGFIGKPQPGRVVAILPLEGGTDPVVPGEEGLLAVHRSDPGLMLGYWQRPEEQAEVMRGDWFIGGDLAAMDADGYVAHRGRANDLMKALGYRVSPLEVEAVLALHPDVAEVACAEVRVRADVMVIGAFVVPRPGVMRDADAILAFASERLAAYKCPRQVSFLDSLPRTATGKIRRSALTGDA